MYFLSFISILGFVGVLSKKYPKYIPIYPLLVSICVILALYLFSMLGLLFYASKIILFAGLGCFAYALFYIISKNEYSPKKIFSYLTKIPSNIWVFLAMVVVWFFYIDSAVLHNPDEYFWAKYAKFFFFNNGLSGEYGHITRYGINYSPIAPLNQYFYFQLSDFTERTLYFSQGILVFSALSYLMSFRRTNYRLNIALVVILFAFLSYFLFSQFGFLSIMLDHLIGIFFGISVLISFFTLKTLKEKMLLLPILFYFTLIKENGLVFAYILVLLNIIHLIITQRKAIKLNMLNVLLILALLVGPYLSYKSWYVYMGRYNVGSKFKISTIAEEIGEPPSAEEDEPQRDKKLISTRFLDFVASKPINSAFQKDSTKIISYAHGNAVFSWILKSTNVGRFSLGAWILVSLIFWILLLFAVSKAERKTFLLMFFGSLFGFSLYLSSLLVAYVYFYPLREALELTSIARYANTYTMGYFIVLIGILIICSKSIFRKDNKLIWKIGIATLLILFVLQIPPLNVFYTYPSINIKMTQDLKEGMIPLINLLKANTEENAKIFVYRKYKDVESPILFYELFPRVLESGKVKRIKTPGQEDIWIPTANAEALLDLLKRNEYKYLVVDRVDDNFWDKNSSLFDDVNSAKSYRLFRIEMTAEGNPKAIPFVQ